MKSTQNREKYANLLKNNLSHTAIFLISFEFDNSELGPPFSVSESWLKEHFQKLFEIQQKASQTTDNPEIHGGKLSYFKDSLYLMTPKK